MLDSAERAKDPLIVACTDILRQSGRFALDPEEVLGWVGPLFTNPATARLRRAAALVSEIASREHPDYRGEIAFARVLRMASVGVTHAERAYLALAAASRYEGSSVQLYATPYLALLSEAQQLEARRFGVTLRLAYTLSGGAPGVLPRVSLAMRDRRLVLTAEPAAVALINDTVRRRLDTVAGLTGVPAGVETQAA
jgi:exopolyphosphatase/guanosine-5'-triphosphate,3'-diphosphate pyrophosphatase